MNLPSIIRIGAESPESFDVYLQPSFSVPRSFDSTARISAVVASTRVVCDGLETESATT